MKSVCLAILNYNGVHHLEQMLPTIQEGAASYQGAISSLVLDNRSTKGDREWVLDNHPEVEVVTAPSNEFMSSYNWLAKQRQEDILILINNDTKLRPGFVESLVRHFHNTELFSVCAHSLDWEGLQDTCGPAQLERSRHGFYRWGFECNKQELCHTVFSSSGFMAVDRMKFLELGGFSRLFFPMYCDDLDLGFRAWRRGWPSIYDPEAVLLHRENGSGASAWVRHHDLRNSLLFEWSSLPIDNFRRHRGPRHANLIVREMLKGRRTWLAAWWEARKIWKLNRDLYRDNKISEAEYQQLREKLSSPVRI